MDPSPTFVLCVGAQKAGTTWLHRYLRQSPGAGATLMKEFHVWNTIYAAGDEPPVIFEGSRSQERHALHRRMVDSPDRYFEYFADLLHGDGVRIVSDMTPSYAALPAEAFLRIKNGFQQRGIALRVVFLMRDPVERCWSAVRMYHRKGLPLPGVVGSGDEEADLMAYCRTANALRHGCYDTTVRNLESVFSDDELLFGFHETMFDDPCVRALSAFLGVEARSEFTDRPLNVSRKTEPLSAATAHAVADAYSPTLAFCSERFPICRSLWPSFGMA